MSINSCAIDADSVDGFCGDRRAVVLAGLIREKYAVRPASPGGARPQPRQWLPPRPEEPWVPPVAEPTLVRVEVELLGVTDYAVAPVTPPAPVLVSVGSLTFRDPS